MISKIYAIKDTKIGFTAPFVMQNDAVAVRAFSGMAQAQQPNQVNTYPDDKELWTMGEYNDQTGEITATQPKYIAKANDFIIKEGE